MFSGHSVGVLTSFQSSSCVSCLVWAQSKIPHSAFLESVSEDADSFLGGRSWFRNLHGSEDSQKVLCFPGFTPPLPDPEHGGISGSCWHHMIGADTSHPAALPYSLTVIFLRCRILYFTALSLSSLL